MIEVKILKFDHYPKDWDLPKYGTPFSACFDIRAIVPEVIRVIPPGRSIIFETGLAFGLPPKHHMFVKSRSGHGFKYDVSLANSEGIIDQDFSGELKIKLINHGEESFAVTHGQAIAQALVKYVEPVKWVLVEKLEKTERGSNGFGSTGL